MVQILQFQGTTRSREIFVGFGSPTGRQLSFSRGITSEKVEPCTEPRPLVAYGPWFYRRLFWESGVIGQVLYLEAEAAGIGATGIGCFFDDPVHQVFGFSDLEFQSLYHFTVGGPVKDSRLTTSSV